MYHPECITAIYDDSYASQYESLYLYPWTEKHELNVHNIKRLLLGLPRKKRRWLDLCCGQAWHFSQFSEPIEEVGVDISASQLKFARVRNPNATFIQGDILETVFPDESFDLVTSFWAGYCYLNSFERIETLVKKAIGWTRPGGALYFEILLPEDLQTFNDSFYAKQNGFHVIPRTPDFREWSYKDVGGHHQMTSPSLAFFMERLLPHFACLEAKHDPGFMNHLIATGKQREYS
jgi:ubiquinone/menaquinone biosynthesis C-methylase UbiE